MSLPVVAILDHSGHFYATVQRRMKHEPFDIYFYYQIPEYIPDLERLQPDLIALSWQVAFPKNHREMILLMRERAGLKDVPIIFSLVATLEEPEAAQWGVEVVKLDPSLEDADGLVAAMHRILDRA